MSYARARLNLGITTVGFWVLLAIAGLFGLPARSLMPIPVEQLIPGIIVVYILFSFPFDLWGGYMLPKRYDRWKGTYGQWFFGWLKGALAQGVIFSASIALLWLVFHQVKSFGWQLGYVVAVQLIFAMLQVPIARLIGRFQVKSPTNNPNVWHSDDIGFTGGVSLMGASVIPEQYQQKLSKTQLDWLLQRRQTLSHQAMNVWGILGAIAFNTLGFIAVKSLTGVTFSHPVDLLTLIWGMSLWSFLGVLVLPTLSQKAVLGLDQLSVQRQSGKASSLEITDLIQTLDRWQDEEPKRHPGIQRIFHPLPSVEQRLNQMQAPASSTTTLPLTWHIARRALFLSWPFMGLLNRAVHCNVGRPDLWVFLPCEG
ncbi:hypothetical protein [Vampirovibrio sp.]|uniref:hypothetical protein n=1 Tax=Vampirovibrio sp. TaxID=2717857 RepID=UPI00359452D1